MKFLYAVLILIFSLFIEYSKSIANLILKHPHNNILNIKKSDLKSRPNKYLVSSIAGGISCGFTHAIVTPLDVIKTRMQVSTKSSMRTAISELIQEGGIKSFGKGFHATLVGYLSQGFLKFGLYEVFKEKIGNRLSEYGYNPLEYKMPIWITGSVCAEVIACLALCPLEVCRISMVTSSVATEIGNVAGTTVSTSLTNTFQSILKSEGVIGLYKGLPFIFMRQLPYSCVKLVAYEALKEISLRSLNNISKNNGNKYKKVNSISSHSNYNHNKLDLDESNKDFNNMLNHHKKKKRRMFYKRNKDEDDVYVIKSLPLRRQLICGSLAGIASAVFSQPADSLLSLMCGGDKALSQCLVIESPMDIFLMWRDMGLSGMYKGVKPRIIMIATLTATQFLLFENVKKMLLNDTTSNDSSSSSSSSSSGSSESYDS